ncbi:SH3 domain-containing protein [Butyrivibrio sp. XB500-5]|uniref:SH3 domain-containing protein n=1 Tax=Butyrivibrio sp. XB500-5 TaxID=2364880 RepID=UPI000EA9927A|nr:SH3 domain-containing protein [Butyrivibrio sp. XB500-5]RKM61647.1 SH3 domain-containing protein [Butyrivibrio sp. XB500-5]
MADKITNFEDYKKKAVSDPVEQAAPVKEESPVVKEEPVKKPDLSDTTVINRIEIEDPYNFFTEEEREAYFRERQKAERARKEPGKETVKEERGDNAPKKEDPLKQETAEVKRPEKAPEPAIRPRRERPRRERREDYYEDDVRDEFYEGDIHRRDYDRYDDDEDYDRDYDRDYDEDYDDDEYDESEDKLMRIVVRIASVLTGLVILTLVGLAVVFKAGGLFHKDPEAMGPEEVVTESPAEEQKKFEVPEGYTAVDDTVTVINNDLNLRNKPKNEEGSEVVAVAKVGTQLKRVAVDGGGYWAIVEFEGQYLYASMNYLSTP